MIGSSSNLRKVPADTCLKERDSEGKPITPKATVRLLGGYIDSKLSWEKHITGAEKSVTKVVTGKLNALRIAAKHFPSKQKLNLANGLIMSTISYLIQCWGFSTKNYAKKIQTLQNSAARFVFNMGMRTNICKLMTGCKWLTVRQLTARQSLMTLWTTVRTKNCHSLQSRIKNDGILFVQSRTMGADRLKPNSLRKIKSRQNWQGMSITWWNRLPTYIRIETNKLTFKREITKWIKNNIPMRF